MSHLNAEKQEYIALEEELVLKIYGFCRWKLSAEQDAEDLAQDICLELIKAIRSGKVIDNLNAFAWGVSNHMFWNWLRKRKRGSTAYLTDIFASEENIEQEYVLREQKTLLRRELAMMSESYRKAVVMFYFDNMTCDEIGKALGKSAGTIKWWLHDARTAIRKGMNTMKEYGEKSYRPGILMMSCQGMPGAGEEPVSCAKRKVAQNILLAAYRHPMSIEELCLELGVSSPYIEDEVGALVENQLMKEVSRGKYQTDFVILPGENAELGDKIYEAAFPEYYQKLMECISANKDKLANGKFNMAGFSWERLLWVYIHIITEIAINKFKYDNDIHVKYQDIPNRPNGGKWIALGYENGYYFQKKPQWKDYHPYDGPVHKTANAFAQGFFHIWSGLDSSVFFEMPDAVFELCKDIIKGNVVIQEMTEEQKYLFSIALEKKLFLKDADVFRLNYYYVNSTECQEIERIACEFYQQVEVLIKEVYSIILREYRSTVPEHLRWQMGNFLSNPLNLLVTCSLYEARKEGILSEPDENNTSWLSLFASE